MATKEQNIDIFQDTAAMFAGLKPSIQASIDRTILFPENETPQLPAPRCAHTEIVVSRRRSLAAASRYRGKHIAVHNFASATHPGGGVTRGSRAQEECLCRCSTLYAVLSADRFQAPFYQYHRNKPGTLYSDRTLYSPGILVLKTDEDLPRRVPEAQRFSVDVITCAAPNLRQSPYNRTVLKPDVLLQMHVKRARHMLAAAASQGPEVLILGAFGCGAFQNPPEIVARAYQQVLREMDGIFSTVEFAVYCPPGDSANYDAFSQVLAGL